ncbi:MAG: RNA methyltransferase, partial [Chloroflexi bacterium]|nr:RNA methyltransferase [Chloroflexota bacterium]
MAKIKTFPAPPLVLALDHLQDPQNFGTLLRTAEAVGVQGVLIPERHSAEITPAVANSSSGAVEYLPIAKVTNLVRTLEQFKKAGLWVAGAEKTP